MNWNQLSQVFFFFLCASLYFDRYCLTRCLMNLHSTNHCNISTSHLNIELALPINHPRPLCLHSSISYYYEFSKEQDYICSKPEDSGMHLCGGLPPYRIGPMVCNGTWTQRLSAFMSGPAAKDGALICRAAHEELSSKHPSCIFYALCCTTF